MIIEKEKNELVDLLWSSEEKIMGMLASADDVDQAREEVLDHLNLLERSHYDLTNEDRLHVIERRNAETCIGVLKNIIRRESEKFTGFSALNLLIKIAKNEEQVLEDVDEGFLCEFVILFKGIHGETGICYENIKFSSDNEKDALIRSKELDRYAESIRNHIQDFNVGTEQSEIERRSKTKKKIMEYFDATERDWNDYHWHLRHIIKDVDTISSLVTLEEDEWDDLSMAENHKIPFQITPYYLSLFNLDGRNSLDRTVRAQVIPTATYCKNMVKSSEEGIDMDFMCEKSMRPHDGITRRYPMIVIVKPFKACPQICIYCQRNWEIKKDDEASSNKDQMEHAIEWIEKK